MGKIVDEEIPEDEAPGPFDDVAEFLGLNAETVAKPSEKCTLGIEDLYAQSWELFREIQHLQPDMRQIRQYLAAKFHLQEADTVAISRDYAEGEGACRRPKRSGIDRVHYE
eukprot:5797147-Pleurochrysis_carterae.AAC.1